MKDNYRMKLIFSALIMLLMLLSSSLVAQNLITHGNFDDNLWQEFDTDYEHQYGLGGDNDTGKFYLGNNAITMEAKCLSFLIIPRATAKRDI